MLKVKQKTWEIILGILLLPLAIAQLAPYLLWKRAKNNIGSREEFWGAFWGSIGGSIFIAATIPFLFFDKEIMTDGQVGILFAVMGLFAWLAADLLSAISAEVLKRFNPDNSLEKTRRMYANIPIYLIVVNTVVMLWGWIVTV